MGRYRKIEVATWHDARFRSLSPAPPNGQTLWLYLLTGPRTTIFPGLIVAREAVMADDLGWSIEAFREAFGEALGEGLVEACWEAGVVVLKKALIDSTGEPRDTSRPESPNVIKRWAKSWDEIPECDLKRRYLRDLGSFAEGLGGPFAEAYREAFRKALAKPSPHPSSNQDSGFRRQEQESPADLSLRSIPDSRTNQPSTALQQIPSVDPDRERRQKLRVAKWTRLNDTRARVAAKLGVKARPLHPQDPGERELADRILESGDKAAENIDHVIAVAEAEAIARGTVQWLTGSLFGEKSWRRALGMTVDDAKRAGPKSSTESPRIVLSHGDDDDPKFDHLVGFGGKP